MARAAVFDRHFRAPIRWREIAFLAVSRTPWVDEEAKYEDHGREAEDHGLEAMAHWHDPRPSPYARHGGRRHLLDDNPCSG
jgi:hypothetical protein